MPSPGRRAQLQIYVSSECVNCAEAHRLAREADGRFRRIVVKVATRPELRPRARQGYTVQPAAAVPPPSHQR